MPRPIGSSHTPAVVPTEGKSAEKKEKLERAVRYKLEIELKRLQAENEELRGSGAALAAAIVASSTAGARTVYPPQRTASYDACHP